MKTLTEVKDEVAQKFGYKNYSDAKKKAYILKDLDQALDLVCQIYAREVPQDALNRAAENAKGKNGRFIPVIDRESITSTEIITP